MNHHFDIEFHDESNGNSFMAQKLNNDTLIALIDPYYPKFRIFSILSYDKKGDYFHAKLHLILLLALIGLNDPKYGFFQLWAVTKDTPSHHSW